MTEEIRKEIAKLLFYWDGTRHIPNKYRYVPDMWETDWEWEWDELLEANKSDWIELADQILSIQTDKHRLAIVETDGELPENPYPNQYITDMGQTTYHIDPDIEAGRIAWMECERDMLKAGWVREVKEKDG